MFLFLLLLLSTSCQEEDTLLNSEYNQYTREVNEIHEFNGATCLVCIDITTIGGIENLNWAIRANKDSTVGQWSTSDAEAAMLR